MGAAGLGERAGRVTRIEDESTGKGGTPCVWLLDRVSGYISSMPWCDRDRIIRLPRWKNAAPGA